MKNLIILPLVFLIACTSTGTKKEVKTDSGSIDAALIETTIADVSKAHPSADKELLGKGVKQTASLWRISDGTPEEFTKFISDNYVSDPARRKVIFNKISNYMESLSGNFNEITLSLRQNLDEARGEIEEIDRMFGNYTAAAHFQDDFFANKIAFAIALNFPYFTLEEKEKLGPEWTREEWAMARLGDFFVSRTPAELTQALGVATGNAEMYISEYNIHMGQLRTDDGRQIFPGDMVLLSHWNLRDELKADYADKEKGPEKQEMIYKVMERIISQEIPAVVINNKDYEWAPYNNTVTKGGTKVEAASEKDKRYEHLLNIFKAMKDMDPFYPEMNTAILRKFSWEMEISQEEVEALFDSYLSSPQLKKLGSLIRERLGRELRPYDIWYDGFKTRSSIPESLLTSKTSALYPDPSAFQAGMPVLLKKLGWSPEKAQYIADKIVVDPARGSGHAWGASMKGSKAHLRTRISDNGMDYKGYNIAVHEFGHNVEQTISLYDVDHYTMTGVPNTAFTEALAFIFQGRDLMLLGMQENNKDKEKMDTFDAAWALMEIMGVGMVEMKVWKWLYTNPQATPSQLKESTIAIAKEMWNKYFAPVFGVKDSPILAIYSHSIEFPLYLPNYAYGHVLQFQIEGFLKERKFSDEINRIYKQGKLTPQQWMMGATGSKISTLPLLNALESALEE